VLTNLRKQIKEFAKYAEECAREAETAPSAVRDHYPLVNQFALNSRARGAALKDQ
jgi:hypothetical protein